VTFWRVKVVRLYWGEGDAGEKGRHEMQCFITNGSSR
jgi:hypothetical protein